MVRPPSPRGNEGSFQGPSPRGMRGSPQPSLKWTHCLKKLVYDEVRGFATHMRCYIEIMGMEPTMERTFVLQFFESPVLVMAEGYSVDLDGG